MSPFSRSIQYKCWKHMYYCIFRWRKSSCSNCRLVSNFVEGAQDIIVLCLINGPGNCWSKGAPGIDCLGDNDGWNTRFDCFQMHSSALSYEANYRVLSQLASACHAISSSGVPRNYRCCVTSQSGMGYAVLCGTNSKRKPWGWYYVSIHIHLLYFVDIMMSPSIAINEIVWILWWHHS